MSKATATPRAVRRQAIIEDVKWMLETQRGGHEIAVRIGLKEDSLDRSLDRWGEHTLARKFRAVAAL